MINKQIFFETDNIYAQDGSVDEYEIAKSCKVVIQGRPLNSFDIASPSSNPSYTHIEDSLYDIVGYVYETYEMYALMSIGDFNIVICNNAKSLKKGQYYTGKVDFVYDIWDCYHLEMYGNDYNINVEGTTKSITLDSSKYKPIEGTAQARTKKGIPSKYNISLEKTSCWEDEGYSNGPVNYLIELDITIEEQSIR